MLCPWIDNACDEKLAEFPPTPPPVLVDKFKERCSVILQLPVLPVISSSAIQYMKCPQLDQFLGHTSIFFGNGSAEISRIEHSDDEGSAESAKLYYQVCACSIAHISVLIVLHVVLKVLIYQLVFYYCLLFTCIEIVSTFVTVSSDLLTSLKQFFLLTTDFIAFLLS